MNKQYALFAFDQYYPDGGWQDFKGCFETVEDALAAAANTTCDCWQIVDLLSGQIIKDGSRMDR